MLDLNQSGLGDDLLPEDSENLYSSLNSDEETSSSLSQNNDDLNTKEETTDEDLETTNKLVLLKSILKDLRANLDKAIKIIEEDGSLVYSGDKKPLLDYSQKIDEMASIVSEDNNSQVISPSQEANAPEGKVVEGVFDGQNMIGAQGKQYSVPANYASKSKLIEGDILKLNIAPNGAFIYKQIGPIERKRLVGVLTLDEENNNFYVLAEGKKYRILTASVTYFKGNPGDEVVIIVPKEGETGWAAVENIMRK